MIQPNAASTARKLTGNSTRTMLFRASLISCEKEQTRMRVRASLWKLVSVDTKQWTQINFSIKQWHCHEICVAPFRVLILTLSSTDEAICMGKQPHWQQSSKLRHQDGRANLWTWAMWIKLSVWKCTLEIQDMQHKLFLGIIAQHKPVVSCTISNWLRKIKQQELMYCTTKDTPQDQHWQAKPRW